MSVPLVDPRADQGPLQQELLASAERVMTSGKYILGREVERFEESLAAYVGARYAVAVSSGSDALVAALLALDVGPGDEVLVPALSFVASAECVIRAGARPRFLDVRPDTLNIDESLLEEAIGPTTRAVIAVHLYGTPCEMDRIRDVAERRGIFVVEDAAQALGASFRRRSAGTWGEAGCFSFYPTKPLGGLGDGGALVTNDGAVAEACRGVRHHGLAHRRGPCTRLGGNYRLDALQAAFLSVKLPHLNQWLEQRRQHAQAYDEALAGHRSLRAVSVAPHARSARCHYTVLVPDEHRQQLSEHLAAHGIASAIYYDRPLTAQPFFERFTEDASFRVAERAARQVLSLPLFPSLSASQRERVIDGLLSYRFE